VIIILHMNDSKTALKTLYKMVELMNVSFCSSDVLCGPLSMTWYSS